MNRMETIERINSHRDSLLAMGVKSLSLFGSVARNEAQEDSDIDFLIEFDRPVGFFHFFDVQEYLSQVLGGKEVDLISRSSLVKEIQGEILEEVVDVL